MKRDLRGEEYKEQQHLMEAELELLTEERSQMILEDEKAKGELRERQRMLKRIFLSDIKRRKIMND